MKNILIVSRYDTMGASSRLRLMQYIPYLRQEGFSVDVSPFISNAYVEALNAGRKFPFFKIVSFYFKRLWVFMKVGRYDLIIVEKEILPWFPAWPERILRLLKIPFIIDIDDATFHRYDRHPSGLVKRLLGRKIARAMQASEAVIAGNPYLANYAWQAGASEVHIIPTVVDLNRYAPREDTQAETLVIGWIGSPTTAPYLELVEKPLQQLAGLIPLKLVLIGAGESGITIIPLEVKKWSEKSEVDEIRAFDIGIMPLFDDDWERGKSGYKIVQYMACGIPVVASPVGVNSSMIDHGVDGFLADDAKEWFQYLHQLAANPRLRREMGIKGRKKAQEKFCIEVTTPQFLNAVRLSL